jgi:MFS family permease
MSTEAAPGRGLPRALKPFGNGQFRLLAIALLFSLFSAGCWIVSVAWQVIELGGSPVDLSLVAVGNAIGLVAAVLIGGVVADRVPQRRILIVVEIVRALCFGTAAFLALSGNVQVWHLAVIGFALGVADGFFYPAYSAWLPAILDEKLLLAANGIEGVLRPTVMQAAGPAVASALIAIDSPGLAFLVIGVLQFGAVTALSLMRTTPLRRDLAAGPQRHPLASAFADLRDGFAYMVKTRWLFATLLFSVVLVLVIMGPIEVLLPFAVKDQTGGGAGAFAIVLGAFGVGGAVGSLLVSSFPLPRRYLTLMILAWGLGCAPLAIIGFTDQLWLMVIVVFTVGVLFDGAQVIWGTLLQRRVPPAMLGRVSSLDFFVSLALMPVSMALAGPVGEAIGIAPTFVAAALIAVVLALGTLPIARLGKDELAHPLDRGKPDRYIVTGGEAASGHAPPVDERHDR